MESELGKIPANLRYMEAVELCYETMKLVGSDKILEIDVFYL